MTDLHTHILPGMDDGSPDTETSIAMLRMERDQGVRRVALTPHFYRDREDTEHFLTRRRAAWETLRQAVEALPPEERRTLPELSLGAEVAWVPNMAEWRHLPELCYQGTRFLLLELPVQKWPPSLFRQILELRSRSGLELVIAHVDRYFDQSRQALAELYSLGLPMQLSAAAFSGFSSRMRAMSLVRRGGALLLISDCHDTAYRPPNLGPAMDLLRRKLGGEAEALFRLTDQLLPEREPVLV